MRQVSGVDEKIRTARGRIDSPQCGLKRRGDVGVGRLVEADVAVADLHECEIRLRGRLHWFAEHPRRGHSAGKSPNQAGAGPGHALQESAAVNAVSAAVGTDGVHLSCFVVQLFLLKSSHVFSSRTRSACTEEN